VSLCKAVKVVNENGVVNKCYFTIYLVLSFILRTELKSTLPNSLSNLIVLFVIQV